MDLSTAPSGRAYTALPIDPTQRVPHRRFHCFQHSYLRIFLICDIGAAALAESSDELFNLPSENAFLVARVDTQILTVRAQPFLFESWYLSSNTWRATSRFFFPQQTVARENLNGQGEFGSVVIEGSHRDGRNHQISGRVSGASLKVSNDITLATTHSTPR